ncbi:MAG: 3-oxo-tetronate kinase [Propylenella sp.]
MLLGAIADDFTGASDLANTLVLGGMRTVQFVGVPSADAAADCEAGVVALKTRSIPAGNAVAQSLKALDWLLRQGCSQIFFKYCSTFDSTPAGNIGPVAEALINALGAPIAVVCPAFPATGRTLYLGHLFVGGRLLNESGLENHPLNPMTDPDIRRWLRRQTRSDVGLVPLPVVRSGPRAIRAALAEEISAGRRLVVVDAIADKDLRTIGAGVADHRLVTGGSGIALGLPANFAACGLLSGRGATRPLVKGPGCVLSGSCSPASQLQVETFLAAHPGLPVDPAALIEGGLNAVTAAGWVLERLAVEPIVYSTAGPTQVAQAQARYGGAKVAGAIEEFFGKLAIEVVDRGVRRMVIGGGETSGAVVGALRIEALTVGDEIDPGVPALAAERNGPLGLVLKSGNFGSADFFEKALNALGPE